jgi:nucleoside-diphosphate-sugar epimerase
VCASAARHEAYEVRVLDKLTSAGRRENLPEGTELIEGVIEDPEVVREAMEGCDAQVHFAEGLEKTVAWYCDNEA